MHGWAERASSITSAFISPRPSFDELREMDGQGTKITICVFASVLCFASCSFVTYHRPYEQFWEIFASSEGHGGTHNGIGTLVLCTDFPRGQGRFTRLAVRCSWQFLSPV